MYMYLLEKAGCSNLSEAQARDDSILLILPANTTKKLTFEFELRLSYSDSLRRWWYIDKRKGMRKWLVGA